jgi:hypothetical protein
LLPSLILQLKEEIIKLLSCPSFLSSILLRRKLLEAGVEGSVWRRRIEVNSWSPWAQAQKGAAPGLNIGLREYLVPHNNMVLGLRAILRNRHHPRKLGSDMRGRLLHLHLDLPPHIHSRLE